MLKNTTPVTASTGKPGKAKYALADGVADRTKAASAELLDGTRCTPDSSSSPRPAREDDMAPTTVTTIVMVVFALFVIAWGLFNLFGNWEPAVRRLTARSRWRSSTTTCRGEMRQAIDDYESGKPLSI